MGGLLPQRPGGHRGRARCADPAGAAMKAPDNKHGESTGTAAPSVHSVRVKIRSWFLANVTDKTFAFSDADWQRIVASLAPDGIDADAITVCEDWWAHRDLMAEPRRPLREQLQNCVACYRGRAVCRKHGDFLTPRQEAAEIQEAVKTLEVARDTLGSATLLLIDTAGTCEALDRHIADAKRKCDRLMATKSPSRLNARKEYSECWEKLLLLWQTMIAQTGTLPGRQQRKEALSQFLLACTEPAFPELRSSSGSRLRTTTKSRIASFLNRKLSNEP